jgi:hypothetical protein
MESKNIDSMCSLIPHMPNLEGKVEDGSFAQMVGVLYRSLFFLCMFHELIHY